MKKNITGIQQVGIGVTNFDEAWKWYRENFGMDIRVFEDEAVAELMLPHTDGKTRKRRAALAINMQGGGGFEIWQHTGKIPEPHKFEIKFGDYGIVSTKIKAFNVEKVYDKLKKNGVKMLGELSKDPGGNDHGSPAGYSRYMLHGTLLSWQLYLLVIGDWAGKARLIQPWHTCPSGYRARNSPVCSRTTR